jgi:hypothetical protein
MTTGRVVGGGPDITAGGYGFRVRRQVGTADLPAPRNDVEVFMTQYSYREAIARRSGALALCTECTAFDNCTMSNNSNQHFGVCQTVKT